MGARLVLWSSRVVPGSSPVFTIAAALPPRSAGSAPGPRPPNLAALLDAAAVPRGPRHLLEWDLPRPDDHLVCGITQLFQAQAYQQLALLSGAQGGDEGPAAGLAGCTKHFSWGRHRLYRFRRMLLTTPKA